MKISIAMTTYNGERFLTKQLESLLNQTCPADEVIICDDCSKDHTAQLLKDFIKTNNLTNWVLHENEHNIGYIKNFYKAISKTTGDIIFLSDQDDIWNSEKIEFMSDIITNNPEIQMLNSSFSVINSADIEVNVSPAEIYPNPKGIRKRIHPKELLNCSCAEILQGDISPGCSAVFTKNLKDIYIKQSSRTIPHDYELNIIAGFINGLYLVDTETMKYRIHDNNTSHISLIQSEEVVSLKIGVDKRDIAQRITTSKNLLLLFNQYSKLLSCATSNELNTVKNFIELHQARVQCLTKFNIKSFMKLTICFLKSKGTYPLKKYLGDICYILGIENKIK